MPTPDGLVEGFNIGSGAVTDRVLGDASVTSIKIASDIQSDNYDGGVIADDPGTVGWRIERGTGDLVINNLVVRGSIEASTLDGVLTMQVGGSIETATTGERIVLGDFVGVASIRFFTGFTVESRHGFISPSWVGTSETHDNLRLSLDVRGPHIEGQDTNSPVLTLRSQSKDNGVTLGRSAQFWNADDYRWYNDGPEIARLTSSMFQYPFHVASVQFNDGVTTQTITTSSWTVVDGYDTISQDKWSLFDADEDHFNVAISGYYAIETHHTWASNTTGQRITRFVRDPHGTPDTTWQLDRDATAGADFVNNQVFLYLAAGEKIAVEVWQDSGGNLVLDFAQFKMIMLHPMNA